MRIDDTVFKSLAERGACDKEEAACLALLDELGITYEGRTHEPGDTIELCEEIETALGAPILKNLFLCNRQQTEFYLLIMPGHKVFKTRFLSSQIGSARLSFADAASMERCLGVRPGSASVLALMNDETHAVRLILDEEILKEDAVGFHPCRNTSTLKLRLKDVTGVFLPKLGITPTVVALPTE